MSSCTEVRRPVVGWGGGTAGQEVSKAAQPGSCYKEWGGGRRRPVPPDPYTGLPGRSCLALRPMPGMLRASCRPSQALVDPLSSAPLSRTGLSEPPAGVPWDCRQSGGSSHGSPSCSQAHQQACRETGDLSLGWNGGGGGQPCCCLASASCATQCPSSSKRQTQLCCGVRWGPCPPCHAPTKRESSQLAPGLSPLPPCSHCHTTVPSHTFSLGKPWGRLGPGLLQCLCLGQQSPGEGC